MASNSPKYRDWFITINQEAECYKEALEILQNLENTKQWAFIIHDKDIQENGTQKATHKHIMLETENPLSFNAMQKRFKGAHIEIPKYKKSAYQYLLHNSPNSKEKYQYDFKEIITKNETLLKFDLESEDFELFKENLFLRYIAEGTRTAYQFTKRFGLNAYKQYWKVYLEMLNELEKDEEMQQDLFKIIDEINNEK